VTVPFWRWLLDQDPQAVSGERFAAQQEDVRWLQQALMAAVELPGYLEAQTAEARGLRRDEVRLLVSTSPEGLDRSMRGFIDLPRWSIAGDLLVVNTSGTLKRPWSHEAKPENVRAAHLHASAGGFWSIEVRRPGAGAFSAARARAGTTSLQPEARRRCCRPIH
jgi:hypothetical protein